MQQTRYRHAHAQKDFDCYDCRKLVAQSSQFVWDNLRNVRICVPCQSKIAEETSSASEKISWAPESGIKPWTVGNYDINAWPEELQREYREIEEAKRKAMYASGFNLTFVDGIARASQR